MARTSGVAGVPRLPRAAGYVFTRSRTTHTLPVLTRDEPTGFRGPERPRGRFGAPDSAYSPAGACSAAARTSISRQNPALIA